MDNKCYLEQMNMFSFPDDQLSYMFLSLLPLHQHVPHVLFSKGFRLEIGNDEDCHRLGKQTSKEGNIETALEYTARSAVRWCLSNFALCRRADSTSTTINRKHDRASKSPMCQIG